MAKVWRFGATSRARLGGCHPDMQRVVNRALELSMVDITVVCGHRSQGEQAALYAQGRTEPGPIVTYVDGVERLSMHNYSPSRAVDLAPYVAGRGIVWDEAVYWDQIERAMKRAADELDIAVEWGGDWNRFVDKPHWQMKSGG